MPGGVAREDRAAASRQRDDGAHHRRQRHGAHLRDRLTGPGMGGGIRPQDRRRHRPRQIQESRPRRMKTRLRDGSLRSVPFRFTQSKRPDVARTGKIPIFAPTIPFPP